MLIILHTLINHTKENDKYKFLIWDRNLKLQQVFIIIYLIILDLVHNNVMLHSYKQSSGHTINEKAKLKQRYKKIITKT